MKDGSRAEYPRSPNAFSRDAEELIRAAQAHAERLCPQRRTGSSDVPCFASPASPNARGLRPGESASPAPGRGG